MIVEPVANFPGFELSSDGRMFMRGYGEVAPETYSNGDLKFVLEHDAWYFSGPCWKLMLNTFYTNISEGMEPEFINGDRSDHSLDNLAFGQVSPLSGLWEETPWVQVGRKRKFDRRKHRPIRVIETGEVFNSLEEVARAVGGQKQNVSACLHGRLRTHMGMTYEYADDR